MGGTRLRLLVLAGCVPAAAGAVRVGGDAGRVVLAVAALAAAAVLAHRLRTRLAGRPRRVDEVERRLAEAVAQLEATARAVADLELRVRVHEGHTADQLEHLRREAAGVARIREGLAAHRQDVAELARALEAVDSAAR